MSCGNLGVTRTPVDVGRQGDSAATEVAKNAAASGELAAGVIGEGLASEGWIDSGVGAVRLDVLTAM